MLSQLVAQVDGPRAARHETRLNPVLDDDRVSRVADLAVTVTRGCGAVEVRVSGPGATLRLTFDPSELPPGDGRCLVRAAVARYRSSLLGRTS